MITDASQKVIYDWFLCCKYESLIIGFIKLAVLYYLIYCQILKEEWNFNKKVKNNYYSVRL
jgi:hypothetical protein